MLEKSRVESIVGEEQGLEFCWRAKSRVWSLVLLESSEQVKNLTL